MVLNLQGFDSQYDSVLDTIEAKEDFAAADAENMANFVQEFLTFAQENQAESKDAIKAFLDGGTDNPEGGIVDLLSENFSDELTQYEADPSGFAKSNRGQQPAKNIQFLIAFKQMAQTMDETTISAGSNFSKYKLDGKIGSATTSDIDSVQLSETLATALSLKNNITAKLTLLFTPGQYDGFSIEETTDGVVLKDANAVEVAIYKDSVLTLADGTQLWPLGKETLSDGTQVDVSTMDVGDDGLLEKPADSELTDDQMEELNRLYLEKLKAVDAKLSGWMKALAVDNTASNPKDVLPAKVLNVVTWNPADYATFESSSYFSMVAPQSDGTIDVMKPGFTEKSKGVIIDNKLYVVDKFGVYEYSENDEKKMIAKSINSDAELMSKVKKDIVDKYISGHNIDITVDPETNAKPLADLPGFDLTNMDLYLIENGYQTEIEHLDFDKSKNFDTVKKLISTKDVSVLNYILWEATNGRNDEEEVIAAVFDVLDQAMIDKLLANESNDAEKYKKLAEIIKIGLEIDDNDKEDAYFTKIAKYGKFYTEVIDDVLGVERQNSIDKYPNFYAQYYETFPNGDDDEFYAESMIA